MPTGTAGRRSCSGGDIYIPRLSLAGTVTWSITRRTCYAPSRWAPCPAEQGTEDGGRGRRGLMGAVVLDTPRRGVEKRMWSPPPAMGRRRGGPRPKGQGLVDGGMLG